jgi:hypothetical protein
MAEPNPDAIPLETDVSAASTDAGVDRRPRIPEPLPVRLIAVEDVHLLAPPGVEEALDALYVGLLQFERLPGELSYRSDNFTLRFSVSAERPLVHDSLRPLGIEVLSLIDTEHKLVDAEIEYTRQRGVTPGSETLLLLDPAGNWLEISGIRLIA